jgi:hypothetical protein
MSAHKTIVFAHLLLGCLALASFWLAALLKKGSPRHRAVGKAYLLAMIGILLTGVPLVAKRYLDGHEQGATFLAYLLVLTGTTVWTSWSAIRHKHAPERYTGPVYRTLAVANLVGASAVIAYGLRLGNPLLIGFPLVGLFVGVDMLRKRKQLDGQPRWWIVEHYTAMLGNGVATHVAFLAIGLPRLLPGVDGMALHYVAWFGPLAGLLVAKLLLDRRWKVPRRPAAPATNAAIAMRGRP